MPGPDFSSVRVLFFIVIAALGGDTKEINIVSGRREMSKFSRMQSWEGCCV